MTAINSVTVLGAGTMGAQIALHFANAGVAALLLDLTADQARQGLEKARKLKPDPQFTPEAYRLVTTGGFDGSPTCTWGVSAGTKTSPWCSRSSCASRSSSWSASPRRFCRNTSR